MWERRGKVKYRFFLSFILGVFSGLAVSAEDQGESGRRFREIVRRVEVSEGTDVRAWDDLSAMIAEGYVPAKTEWAVRLLEGRGVSMNATLGADLLEQLSPMDPRARHEYAKLLLRGI